MISSACGVVGYFCLVDGGFLCVCVFNLFYIFSILHLNHKEAGKENIK